MLQNTRRTFTLVMAAVVLSTCGPDDETPPEVVAVFDLESAALFDAPFPSEVRRGEDGRVDVSTFPNPRSIGIVHELVDAVGADLEGFGTTSAVYFRFSGPIDTAGLPAAPSVTTSDASPFLLVNVDDSSDAVGERIPLRWLWRETVSDFWSPHTLVLLPVAGFALRPDTLYALFLTDDVHDTEGRPVLRDAGFETLIDSEPDFGPSYSDAEVAYREAMFQAELEGLDQDRIVSAAVFRTQDPLSDLVALHDDVEGNVDVPEVLDLEYVPDDEGDRPYHLYDGHWGPNPIYQRGFGEGLSPYTSDGGDIRFDASGDPIQDGEETMRLAITLPDGDAPPGGWPVVLYAHGTGGNYTSFTRNGAAETLAARGIAVVGIDNAMNGARIPPDGDPDTLFFNVNNIWAARDNVRQAAVDMMQLERLVPEVEIDSETSHDGEVHVFSVNQMGYMGHSQGGLNGALYLAVSERCRGAYLSGAGGGLLYSLVHKTEPVRIRNTIGILVGFTGTTEELDEEDFGIFHPVLNLLQMFYESADGVNYGRYWFWETLPGVPPKSVLMTEGLGDSYSPEATIEALAVAGELDPVLPQLTDPVPGFILKGRDLLIPPVVGNASLDGTVTAGLKQYPESDDYDGHFVSYHDPDAIATWSGFLTQLTTGFVPVIE